ncbi:MAG TPA: HNH endonuclease [Kiritimatiellia bacterium]|nr:HNH endonuclease [Kiritimatiellia bacterium]
MACRFTRKTLRFSIVKYWVGITDKQWFTYLAALAPEEVNFWRPSSTQNFGAIEVGAPFLFKLHSPDNFIVGGGFFVRHTTLPLSLAWETFERNNGTDNLFELHRRISHFSRKTDPDPVIGCTVLTEPFFFQRADWIPVPASWSPNIVVGKTYDTEMLEGAALWRAVNDRLSAVRNPIGKSADEMIAITKEDRPLYGNDCIIRPRLGQGGFRVVVTDAYNRRCAMSGERTLPVLQASHIKPYALNGPHNITNGLLLRSDLHILYDRGYVAVTPDYQILVSKRIKEEFSNGREYYALNGRPLVSMPSAVPNRPSRDYLEWHCHNVFKS